MINNIVDDLKHDVLIFGDQLTVTFW